MWRFIMYFLTDKIILSTIQHYVIIGILIDVIYNCIVGPKTNHISIILFKKKKL